MTLALVTVALDHDLSAILLLSQLSEHTRHLMADPRAALLLDGTEGHANPQTGPRVTLAMPGRPVSLPMASAMKAAPPSWRQTVTARAASCSASSTAR